MSLRISCPSLLVQVLARGEGMTGVLQLAIASMMGEVAQTLRLEITPGAEFAMAAQGSINLLPPPWYVPTYVWTS